MLGTGNPLLLPMGHSHANIGTLLVYHTAFGQKSAPPRRHSSWIKMKWVYAKSLGRNTKIDRIDARVGARYDG